MRQIYEGRLLFTVGEGEDREHVRDDIINEIESRKALFTEPCEIRTYVGYRLIFVNIETKTQQSGFNVAGGITWNELEELGASDGYIGRTENLVVSVIEKDLVALLEKVRGLSND